MPIKYLKDRMYVPAKTLAKAKKKFKSFYKKRPVTVKDVKFVGVTIAGKRMYSALVKRRK